MFDPSRISNYPEAPGVYLMKSAEGTVLYVGKAKNIRKRVKQYFSSSGDNRVQVPILLSQLAEVEFVVTSSEEEALLLEANLIKKFRPKYNVLLKDDRSGLCVRVGHEHPWPRIELVRAHEADALPPRIFGPYGSSGTGRQIFDLVIRLFQLRQCSDDTFARRKSPCLLYQIRRCTAPCVNKVTKEAYWRQVDLAEGVLSGEVAALRAEMTQRMQEASNKMEYEVAAMWRDRLSLLDSACQSPAKGVSTDVFGAWQEEQRLAMCVLHYRNSALVYGESWDFSLQEAALSSEYQEQVVVQYYLQQEREPPKELLLPPGEWNRSSISSVLSSHFGKQVRVQQPEAGKKKTMIALACSNAQAKMFVDKRGKDVLSSLQEHLSLSRLPRIIDCFDASHLAGKDLVAACVGFVDGKKSTYRYRTFRMREIKTGDDLAMIKEAVERRYRERSDIDPLPDMILVDGGKTQLQAVLDALKNVPFFEADVVALAKERGRHDRGMASDSIFVAGQSLPIALAPSSEMLLFLQRIRDEAHRFAISFHRRRRSVTAFTSAFDGIKGLGEKKKKKLLMAFQGLHEIERSSVEEIQKRTSLGRKNAEKVLQALCEKKKHSTS